MCRMNMVDFAPIPSVVKIHLVCMRTTSFEWVYVSCQHGSSCAHTSIHCVCMCLQRCVQMCDASKLNNPLEDRCLTLELDHVKCMVFMSQLRFTPIPTYHTTNQRILQQTKKCLELHLAHKIHYNTKHKYIYYYIHWFKSRVHWAWV